MVAAAAHTSAAALEESVTRLAHVLLRESAAGLSRSAASVLARLRAEGPQRVTDLAAWESVSQPSMTALVGRLADHGLVERLGDPADRRAVLVALTEEGRARLRERRDARAEALARRMEILSAPERRLLDRAAALLQRLAEVRA
jgi:DNA-binding MarR family transcriptional regulator